MAQTFKDILANMAMKSKPMATQQTPSQANQGSFFSQWQDQNTNGNSNPGSYTVLPPIPYVQPNNMPGRTDLDQTTKNAMDALTEKVESETNQPSSKKGRARFNAEPAQQANALQDALLTAAGLAMPLPVNMAANAAAVAAGRPGYMADAADRTAQNAGNLLGGAINSLMGVQTANAEEFDSSGANSESQNSEGGENTNGNTPPADEGNTPPANDGDNTPPKDNGEENPTNMSLGETIARSLSRLAPDQEAIDRAISGLHPSPAQRAEADAWAAAEADRIAREYHGLDHAPGNNNPSSTPWSGPSNHNYSQGDEYFQFLDSNSPAAQAFKEQVGENSPYLNRDYGYAALLNSQDIDSMMYLIENIPHWQTRYRNATGLYDEPVTTDAFRNAVDDYMWGDNAINLYDFLMNNNNSYMLSNDMSPQDIAQWGRYLYDTYNYQPDPDFMKEWGLDANDVAAYLATSQWTTHDDQITDAMRRYWQQMNDVQHAAGEQNSIYLTADSDSGNDTSWRQNTARRYGAGDWAQQNAQTLNPYPYNNLAQSNGQRPVTIDRDAMASLVALYNAQQAEDSPAYAALQH